MTIAQVGRGLLLMGSVQRARGRTSTRPASSERSSWSTSPSASRIRCTFTVLSRSCIKPDEACFCGFPCHLTLFPLTQFRSGRQPSQTCLWRDPRLQPGGPQHHFSDRPSIALMSKKKGSSDRLAERLSGCQTVAARGGGPALAARR